MTIPYDWYLLFVNSSPFWTLLYAYVYLKYICTIRNCCCYPFILLSNPALPSHPTLYIYMYHWGKDLRLLLTCTFISTVDFVDCLCSFVVPLLLLSVSCLLLWCDSNTTTAALLVWMCCLIQDHYTLWGKTTITTLGPSSQQTGFLFSCVLGLFPLLS